MILKLMTSRFFLFLFPIFTALALFFVLNLDCGLGRGPVQGDITILYTSDVGGAIDPCG